MKKGCVMTSLMATSPRELITLHREALVKYGTMALIKGEQLSALELEDHRKRMEEFLGLGSAFGLTEREMVAWMYRGVFAERKCCGCHSCRAREGEEA